MEGLRSGVGEMGGVLESRGRSDGDGAGAAAINGAGNQRARGD